MADYYAETNSIKKLRRNKVNLPNVLQPIIFEAKKNSPSILMGAGITAIVIGGIWACQATLKAAPVLDKHKEDIDAVKKHAEEDKDYKDKGRDLTAIYKRTCCDLTRLYIRSIITVGIGIAMVGGSNYILSDQKAKALAFAASTNAAFTEYRGHVIEDQGIEADWKYMTGEKEVEVEETEVTPNGKTKKVKKKYKVSDPNAKGSGHLFYIGPGNRYYNKDPEMFGFTMNQKQNYLNERFAICERMVVDDIMRELEIPINEQEPTTLVDGWLKRSPSDHIEFDVRQTHIPGPDGEFVPVYAVDMNVQGNIYEVLKNAA